MLFAKSSCPAPSPKWGNTRGCLTFCGLQLQTEDTPTLNLGTPLSNSRSVFISSRETHGTASPTLEGTDTEVGSQQLGPGGTLFIALIVCAFSVMTQNLCPDPA